MKIKDALLFRENGKSNEKGVIFTSMVIAGLAIMSFIVLNITILGFKITSFLSSVSSFRVIVFAILGIFGVLLMIKLLVR